MKKSNIWRTRCTVSVLILIGTVIASVGTAGESLACIVCMVLAMALMTICMLGYETALQMEQDAQAAKEAEADYACRVYDISLRSAKEFYEYAKNSPHPSANGREQGKV